MKITLGYKLFAGIALLNLVISALFAVFLYRTASEKYFQKFRDHKLSVTRFMSSTIDGDFHKTIVSPDDMKKPGYRYYLKLMSSLRDRDGDIRYIYSLNYDRERDALHYAVDGNINRHDRLWFETSHFAFSAFYGDDAKLTVEYNSIHHQKDFVIKTDIGEVPVSIRSGPGGDTIAVHGKTVFSIRGGAPLSAATPGGSIDRNRLAVEGPIVINGHDLTCTFSFAEKGNPESFPGAAFIEKDEVIAEIKKVIETGASYIDTEDGDSAFGIFMSSYSAITDGKGRGIGVVIMDINAREIAEMRMEFFRTAAMVFAAAFLISTVISIFLARHFSGPVARLMRGVVSLGEGDLSTMVDIKSSDEFGTLAAGFNAMVRNLDAASREQKELIEEIRNLNESLERRVVERTTTIEAQSRELNSQIMMARRIQMSLLPKNPPPMESIRIDFKYRPMMAVGGDFIDFQFSDNAVMLFICDVSGHGVSAAFLSAMVKMSLPQCYEEGRSPARALVRLHDALRGKMGGHFITAAFCRLDLGTGTLVTANAGHLPLILKRKNGDIEYLRPPGKIIIENFPPEPEEITATITAGDSVILYTDGIVEARNSESEMFGESRLEECIQNREQGATNTLCDDIYLSVIKYSESGAAEIEDDIALIVAEYRGSI